MTVGQPAPPPLTTLLAVSKVLPGAPSITNSQSPQGATGTDWESPSNQPLSTTALKYSHLV